MKAAWGRSARVGSDGWRGDADLGHLVAVGQFAVRHPVVPHDEQRRRDRWSVLAGSPAGLKVMALPPYSKVRGGRRHRAAGRRPGRSGPTVGPARPARRCAWVSAKASGVRAASGRGSGRRCGGQTMAQEERQPGLGRMRTALGGVRWLTERHRGRGGRGRGCPAARSPAVVEDVQQGDEFGGRLLMAGGRGMAVTRRVGRIVVAHSLHVLHCAAPPAMVVAVCPAVSLGSSLSSGSSTRAAARWR